MQSLVQPNGTALRLCGVSELSYPQKRHTHMGDSLKPNRKIYIYIKQSRGIIHLPNSSRNQNFKLTAGHIDLAAWGHICAFKQ